MSEAVKTKGTFSEKKILKKVVVQGFDVPVTVVKAQKRLPRAYRCSPYQRARNKF